MQTPTTAHLHTSIDVLKTLDDHIYTYGNHSIHQCRVLNTLATKPRKFAQMASNRTLGSQASSSSWKVHISWCRRNGSHPFLIMFNFGHALPLRFRRFRCCAPNCAKAAPLASDSQRRAAISATGGCQLECCTHRCVATASARCFAASLPTLADNRIKLSARLIL